MDNKVVLFVDLLGFASLTEAHPIDVDLINAYERPSGNIDKLWASRDNLLTEAFTRFHHSLKWTIDMAKMRHPVTAITFSDSAFIVTTHLFEAAIVAVELIRSLLSQRVPMRIGIAHGSFEAVRFRSDVTVDSGDHAAHFLGTGVVRAHAAEKCGIKGIRILLHSSVLPLLQDASHMRPPVRAVPAFIRNILSDTIDLGDTIENAPSVDQDQIRYLECSGEESRNTVGVRYEIDYWSFKPTAEAEAWHALQDMWNAAPQFAQNHYQATAEAINRMRTGQGEPALNNLRRRTLPRKIRNS